VDTLAIPFSRRFGGVFFGSNLQLWVGTGTRGYSAIGQKRKPAVTFYFARELQRAMAEWTEYAGKFLVITPERSER
jgi:hypothetical protein